MPSPARRSDPDETSVAAVIPLHKPKLVVAHGRGGSGKSTVLRYLAERAQDAGREIVIADADRTNATLAAFFEGVVRPEHGEEVIVADWLDALVTQQAEEQLTVLLDMGGGDQVFDRFAREVQLADLMASAGVVPVALHCIGTDLDDLAYLRSVEEAGAFCPEATVLLLNEGVIRDGRPRDAAFSGVRAHPIFRKALERGAREVWFPRLPCMQAVNDGRLLFGKAEALPSFGLTNRQRVVMWRRAVEEALLPVREWMP